VTRLLGGSRRALGSCAELQVGGGEEGKGVKPMFGVEGWGKKWGLVVVVGGEESELSSGLGCGFETCSRVVELHGRYL